jgi:hypothetical protein
MDALLSSTAPIGGPSRSSRPSSSSTGGHKRKARPSAPHKTVVKGPDGERVDPVVHQIGPNTRAPKSLHSHDDLRPPKLGHVKDLKLRAKLSKMALDEQRAQKSRDEATMLHEGRAGMMEPSTELEKTYKVSQAEIREAGGLAAAAKGFDLDLDGGNGGVVGRWGRDGRCVSLCLILRWPLLVCFSHKAVEGPLLLGLSPARLPLAFPTTDMYCTSLPAPSGATQESRTRHQARARLDHELSVGDAWLRDLPQRDVSRHHVRPATLNYSLPRPACAGDVQARARANETQHTDDPLLSSRSRYLHSSSFFAVAQKKHVFIYDQDGTELQCVLS